MKKTAILLAIMMALAGCGQSEPAQEGITLSRAVYDELMAAKNENDALKQEVETLRKRLESLTGETFENDSAGQAGDDASGTAETAASTTETHEAAEAPEPTTQADSNFSGDEIAAMTLVPYKDSYGIFGLKNTDGEVVVEPDFDAVGAFSNGLAKITSGGKEGTISDRGEIVWNDIETYTEATVKPQNDVKEGSSFAAFLEEYRQALADRDKDYIKAHTHPNVKISFGGHSGWDGLVSYWSLDEGSEGFYKMMNTTLKYGAVDTSGGLGNAFTVPYYFENFPSGYDESFGVCVGEGVNLRSRPSTDFDVVGQSTYGVLKILEPEKDGWTKIMTPAGDRAYIYGQYLKSPLGYRASFTKVDNTWLLDFFVKGD